MSKCGVLAALEVVANLYDSFLTIFLCTLYFGSRFEGWRQKRLPLPRRAAFAGVMAWLNSYSVFEGFGGIFYSLVIVLYAWVALEGGIFQKLFFSLFWNCVLMLSGFGVVLFLSLSGLCPPEEWSATASVPGPVSVCCMALRLSWPGHPVFQPPQADRTGYGRAAGTPHLDSVSFRLLSAGHGPVRQLSLKPSPAGRTCSFSPFSIAAFWRCWP